MERVNFYIDGFNFYYGLKRLKATDCDWKKIYWIDFVKFCQHFIGDNQTLQKVYYFTASPLSIQKSNRQAILFEANKLINGSRLELIKGMFYEKKIRIYFPPDNFSSALRDFMRANKGKVIRLEKSKIKFLNSIMPDTVTEGAISFTIPSKWKEQ